MNIIILHSPNNSYKKSNGPPCLYTIKNQKTVLEKQLEEIYKSFKNPKIEIITDCKPKKIKPCIKDYSNISLTEYNINCNDLQNIHNSIQKINKKCIIISGNIIFNHKIFDNIDKSQSEMLLSNSHILELGCTLNNNIIQNISWSLPISWINIIYLCNTELNLLKTISMPEQPTKNWFLFEGINWIIRSNGKINGKLIDNKIKIINEPDKEI